MHAYLPQLISMFLVILTHNESPPQLLSPKASAVPSIFHATHAYPPQLISTNIIRFHQINTGYITTSGLRGAIHILPNTYLFIAANIKKNQMDTQRITTMSAVTPDIGNAITLLRHTFTINTANI